MELIVNVGDVVILVEVTDEVGDDGDDVLLVEVKDDFGDGIITVEDSVEDDLIVEEVTDDVGDDVLEGLPSILSLCVDAVEVTDDDGDEVDLVLDVGDNDIISGYDVRVVLADESPTQETDTSSLCSQL